MSVDASQIPLMIKRDAYPVMFEKYAAQPVIYPQITEVHPIPLGLMGTKGSVIAGMGELLRTLDGEEIQKDTLSGSFTWIVAIHRYTRGVEIPQRMLDAADAAGKVSGLLSEFGAQWGRVSPGTKEQLVANVFQKGTLSAGDKTVFDNTFDDQSELDAYPGFIYDGKPFFAATGNGHPFMVGSDTGVNLTAVNALTSANLQTVLTTMRVTNAVGERGLKTSIQPNTLLIPPGLEFTAKTLLNSTNVVGSANNDVNVVQGIVNPIVWRYLTDDADAWWLGALGQGGGVHVWDSGVPVIETSYDAARKVHLVTGEFQFGVTVQDWRQWYANNKATS